MKNLESVSTDEAVPRPGRRRRLLWLLGLLGIVITFLFFGASVMRPDGEAENGEERDTISLYAAIARGRVDVEGGIIQLAARRDGIIKKFFAEEGDFVKAHQILAALDDRKERLDLKLALKEMEEAVGHIAQAEKQLAQAALLPELNAATIAQLEVETQAAKREEKRLRELLAVKAAPAAEWEAAKDRTAVAEIKLKEARTKARYESLHDVRERLASAHATKLSAEVRAQIAQYEIEQRLIRAPMDGRVIRRLARPGDGVSTLNVTPLFWFAPESPRIIRAELEERFITSVKQGMKAEVVIESDESQTFTATVHRLGLLFGPRKPVTDDPYERFDVRVTECVLTIADAAPQLLLGQRVMVRFRKEP
ncbi:MAG: HlyD family efflux transporter periplasmic adaptor subunit [Acidobacteria bacterium]|nr:HlyD family efflux transporter periplasmic adaptor subunit [Acidobacteriota bacterium]